MTKKYGYNNEDLANFMNSFGLFPIKYDPIKRKLKKLKILNLIKIQFLLNFEKLNFLSKMQNNLKFTQLSISPYR